MGGAGTTISSYRDLTVWKAAVELAVACYGITGAFPNREIYGMASQIRRASASIAANIAEGHGRESTASFVQFLRIAQGSLKEVETHLIISARVGLLSEEGITKLLMQSDEIGRMLRSMIRSLQKRS